MGEPRRVLLLTNAELGQANVFLAVSHELLRLDPTLKLHIASFSALYPQVSAINSSSSASLNDDAATESRPGGPIDFIELKGPSWKEALFDRPEHQFQELNDLRPTVWNIARAAKMTRIACPWTSEEVCSLIKQMEKIIGDLKPNLVVVDNLFTPAVTICYKLKPKWAVLSPNTYKEFVLAHQPQRQYYWKYSPPRSTIPFPVPWYYVPLVYYTVKKMYMNHGDTWMVDHAKKMKESIDTDYADWAYISIVPPEGLEVLLASRPEIDFPFDVVPSHITGCGPIVMPSTTPLEESDPDLARWLTQKPTIYVNRGTHATSDENEAVEMAKALGHLLKKAEKAGKKFQVLWKLRTRGGSGGASRVAAALGEDLIKNDVVRITEWIKPEPTAILESGHIVCSVHHGGANSYFEAVSAGIPQVVLPVWGDTYDFAQRVEFLGIGKFGSPGNAPKCAASELGPILVKVILGSGAAAMTSAAARLAKVCKSDGGGRNVAARKLLELL